MAKAGKFLRSTGVIICFLTFGCARFASQPTGAVQIAAQPVPRLRDCAVVQTGSPSRFACNGKIYTSFQLAKLRENEARRFAAGQ